jgi:hypothetical protein
MYYWLRQLLPMSLWRAQEIYDLAFNEDIRALQIPRGDFFKAAQKWFDENKWLAQRIVMKQVKAAEYRAEAEVWFRAAETSGNKKKNYRITAQNFSQKAADLDAQIHQHRLLAIKAKKKYNFLIMFHGSLAFVLNT